MMQLTDSDRACTANWESGYWFFEMLLLLPGSWTDSAVPDEDAELAEASARALRRATLEDDDA